jgi:beta-glucanase (GH16 family)
MSQSCTFRKCEKAVRLGTWGAFALVCMLLVHWDARGGTVATSGSTVAIPTFSTISAQNGAVILSITSDTKGAEVHYTIDGAIPTATSPTYLAPILISSKLIFRAIAIRSDETPSSVSTWTLPTTPASGTLVWSDEFTNTAGAKEEPNPTVWGYDTGGSGWGNAELEDYCRWNSSNSPCDSADPNAYVGTDGYLHLVARRSSSGAYSSARIKSEGLFSILYGRVEARIQVPEAQGFWPAFWMLGNNRPTNGWPACGEIDIQERVNAAETPDWNKGSIHGSGFTGTNIGDDYHFPGGQTAGGFHTYGMIWSPGKIQFYIDSPTNIYATFTPASLASLKGAMWPFDSGNAQFILLNLAIGGSWPGKPADSTPFPSQILVDYVRVYAY